MIYYSGKYLNRYGDLLVGGVVYVFFGWDEWFGLLGNFVYYDYILLVNGKLEKYGDIYSIDYFIDVLVSIFEMMMEMVKMYCIVLFFFVRIFFFFVLIVWYCLIIVVVLFFLELLCCKFY